MDLKIIIDDENEIIKLTLDYFKANKSGVIKDDYNDFQLSFLNLKTIEIIDKFTVDLLLKYLIKTKGYKIFFNIILEESHIFKVKCQEINNRLLFEIKN